MPLIHKLCALLRHPFRRLIRMDIDCNTPTAPGTISAGSAGRL